MATESTPPVELVVIGGSVREDNYTDKALDVLAAGLRRHPGVNVQQFRPREMHIPLAGREESSADVDALFDCVSRAQGVVLGTPLYNGSYSCVTKAVIDTLGYPSALTGKPVALVGVAASPFGAETALRHLHEVCVHVCAQVLPEHVNIGNVWELFDDQGRCVDEQTAQALQRLADELVDFVRVRGVVHDVAPPKTG
jgi:NAD(P)H-dependent FMN reductase